MLTGVRRRLDRFAAERVGQVRVLWRRSMQLRVVLSTLAQNISGHKIGADYATVTGELLAASSIALIPLLVVFVLLQRHFISGILAGSVKG